MYQTYLSFAPYIKNWYNLRHLSKWNCLWKTKKGRRSCVVYNYTNVYFFLNMFNLSVRPDAKTLLFFLFFKSLKNILEGFKLNSKLFFSHNLSQIANWRTIVRKVNKSLWAMRWCAILPFLKVTFYFSFWKTSVRSSWWTFFSYPQKQFIALHLQIPL